MSNQVHQLFLKITSIWWNICNSIVYLSSDKSKHTFGFLVKMQPILDFHIVTFITIFSININHWCKAQGGNFLNAPISMKLENLVAVDNSKIPQNFFKIFDGNHTIFIINMCVGEQYYRINWSIWKSLRWSHFTQSHLFSGHFVFLCIWTHFLHMSSI